MTYQEHDGLEVTLSIDAPREDVFDVVSATDRWPDLITVIDDGEVLTPHAQGEGVELQWDVTVAGFTIDVHEKIDRFDPPEMFTWISLDCSRWNHEGGVRFEEVSEETTSVHAYMDYDLPVVVDNRFTRELFKRRFQTEMEQSFRRVKEQLER